MDVLLPATAMGGSVPSSHQTGGLKQILSGLRADGEEGRQVEALTHLCDMLSIGTEDSLSTFSVDSFVPVLVGLLNHENQAENSFEDVSDKVVADFGCGCGTLGVAAALLSAE